MRSFLLFVLTGFNLAALVMVGWLLYELGREGFREWGDLRWTERAVLWGIALISAVLEVQVFLQIIQTWGGQ